MTASAVEAGAVTRPPRTVFRFRAGRPEWAAEGGGPCKMTRLFLHPP